MKTRALCASLTLCLTLFPRQGMAAEQADCLLEIVGTRYIDGPCQITSVSINGRSNSLRLEQYSGSEVAFAAQVTLDGPREADATWTGSTPFGRSLFSLGRVSATGACWQNAYAKICAWKPGEARPPQLEKGLAATKPTAPTNRVPAVSDPYASEAEAGARAANNEQLSQLTDTARVIYYALGCHVIGIASVSEAINDARMAIGLANPQLNTRTAVAAGAKEGLEKAGMDEIAAGKLAAILPDWDRGYFAARSKSPSAPECSYWREHPEAVTAIRQIMPYGGMPLN